MIPTLRPIEPFSLKPRGLHYGAIKALGFFALPPEVSPREHARNQHKRGSKEPPRQPKRAWWTDTARYTGEQLRKLRAERGVGRPPGIEAKLRRVIGHPLGYYGLINLRAAA